VFRSDALRPAHVRGTSRVAILGSGALVRSLIPHGFIDEYTLLIHSLTLGSGERLFPENSSVQLKLISSVPTTTGVIIARYQPA
jgi:dihydrofolate reductase